MACVVVLGAGPAGAACGLFLARRGHRVTVLEQTPEQGGTRAGRHVRQGHSFLALGTRVLDEERPDVVDALEAAGAQRVPLNCDPQHWNLLARRPLLDRVLREALAREPGVRFVVGARATGLLFAEPQDHGVPRVVGIATAGQEITGDVVVDAGGRNSPIPRWLKAHGRPLAVEDDRTPFIYITRHYRLKGNACFPPIRVPIVEALDYASILAFPEDGGNFQLSVHLHCRDPAKRAMSQAAMFDRFLSAVPLTRPWIARGHPLSDPETFATIGNRRTRVAGLGPAVSGLLMVGDAALQTNPSAGRGVSLALAHAQALAVLLDGRHGATAHELTADWERVTDELLGPWFESQVQIDRERQAQIEASIAGEPCPGNSLGSRLAAALGADDAPPDVSAAGERILNLLTTPGAVFRDRDFMRRLLRASRDVSVAPPRGPSRREFELMTLGPHAARA